MNQGPKNPSPDRKPRYEINLPCTVLPWNVEVTLENMSASGALLDCADFPEELLTTINGELIIEDLELPGEFVRVDKVKIAIEFFPFDHGLEKQVESFLNRFGKHV